MNTNKFILGLLFTIACLGLLYWVSTSPKTEPTTPATADLETEAGSTTSDYTGLTTAQAVARAESNDVLFRVVEIDGEPQMVTEDFRPGRINATVENDVVVSYTVEGSESGAMDNPYFQDNQLDGDMIDAQTPSNGTDSNTNDAIIGMTTAEAEAYAEANDVMFRIGAIDGEFLPVTMDYRPGRITAEIEDDIVTGYTVE